MKSVTWSRRESSIDSVPWKADGYDFDANLHTGHFSSSVLGSSRFGRMLQELLVDSDE